MKKRMTDEHPNITLLNRLDLNNLAGAADLFAEDFVWHFFNPHLPDIAGDYVGLHGLQSLFDKLGSLTGGTFSVHPVSATAMGDELIVVHTKNRLTFQGTPIETDVVVVWRVVDGRFTEVWDIPSVHSVRTMET